MNPKRLLWPLALFSSPSFGQFQLVCSVFPAVPNPGLIPFPPARLKNTLVCCAGSLVDMASDLVDKGFSGSSFFDASNWDFYNKYDNLTNGVFNFIRGYLTTDLHI